jgi:hypothetical protein
VRSQAIFFARGKALSTWSYADLDHAVTVARGQSLFDIVSAYAEDVNEARIIDAVSKNLRRGQFLLLIVGDGIREGVEHIASYLQSHAGLNFTFGLVELSLFQHPTQKWIVVQPRVLARTFEIERAVIRNDVGNTVVVSDAYQNKSNVEMVGSSLKRTTLSERQFLDELSRADTQLPNQLMEFINKLDALGVSADFGSGSLNLRWSSDGPCKFNFGSILRDGRLRTDPCNWGPGKIGRSDIGHRYQEQLAGVVSGAAVKKNLNAGHWRVVIDEQLPPVSAFLSQQDRWLAVIKETQSELEKALVEAAVEG